MSDQESRPTMEELSAMMEEQRKLLAAMQAQQMAQLQAAAQPPPRRRRYSPWIHAALSPLKRPIHLAAVAVVATVWVLSPAVSLATTGANTWTAITAMPTPRYSLASTEAPCPSTIGAGDPCIYAIGGINGNGALSTVEAYDIVKQTWTSSDTGGPCANGANLPCLPAPHYGLSAVTAPCPTGATGTCVYAIGGYNPANPASTEDFYDYNPSTNAWSADCSGNGGSGKPLACGGGAYLGAAAVAPCTSGLGPICIYTTGGYRTAGGCFTGSACVFVTNRFEMYAPGSNCWMGGNSQTPCSFNPPPQMPTQLGGLAAAAAPCPGATTGSCVYVVGGYDGRTATQIVEVYDPNPPGNSFGQWFSSGDASTCYASGCQPGTVVGSQSSTGTASLPTTACAHATPDCMPTARENLGAAVAHCPNTSTSTCVYAVGGDKAFSPGLISVAGGASSPPGLNVTEAYDTGSNIFNAGGSGVGGENPASMPTPRYGLATASGPCPGGTTGTCIYALGGNTDASSRGITAAAEVYSPTTNGTTAAEVARFSAKKTGSNVNLRWTMANTHGVAGFIVYAGAHRLNKRVIRPHHNPNYHYGTNWWGSGPFDLYVILFG